MGWGQQMVRMGAAISAAGLLGIAASTLAQDRPQRPIYKDASQPVERRVEDLLSRMTLEEKAAQLVTVWEHKDRIQTDDGTFSPAEASQNFPNGLGQIARPSDRRGVTVANAGAAGAAEGGVGRERYALEGVVLSGVAIRDGAQAAKAVADRDDGVANVFRE